MRNYFHDYTRIKKMREDQRNAEMSLGRHRTLKSMGDGLLQQIVYDIGLVPGTNVVLRSGEDMDFRGWTVEVTATRAPGMVLSEKFIDFPTDHMKAQLLLMGLLRDKK